MKTQTRVGGSLFVCSACRSGFPLRIQLHHHQKVWHPKNNCVSVPAYQPKEIRDSPACQTNIRLHSSASGIRPKMSGISEGPPKSGSYVADASKAAEPPSTLHYGSETRRKSFVRLRKPEHLEMGRVIAKVCPLQSNPTNPPHSIESTLTAQANDFTPAEELPDLDFGSCILPMTPPPRSAEKSSARDCITPLTKETETSDDEIMIIGEVAGGGAHAVEYGNVSRVEAVPKTEKVKVPEWDSKPVKCGYCTERFRNLREWHAHAMEKHKDTRSIVLYNKRPDQVRRSEGVDGSEHKCESKPSDPVVSVTPAHIGEEATAAMKRLLPDDLRERRDTLWAKHLKPRLMKTGVRSMLHDCPYAGCWKTFTSVQQLRVHKIRVHEKSSRPCRICPQKFKSSLELYWHYKKAHKSNKEDPFGSASRAEAPNEGGSVVESQSSGKMSDRIGESSEMVCKSIAEDSAAVGIHEPIDVNRKYLLAHNIIDAEVTATPCQIGENDNTLQETVIEQSHAAETHSEETRAEFPEYSEPAGGITNEDISNENVVETCEILNQPTSGAAQHLKGQHGCPFCAQKFRRTTSFESHLCTKHRVDESEARAWLLDQSEGKRLGPVRLPFKLHMTPEKQRRVIKCNLCHRGELHALTLVGIKSLRKHLRKYHCVDATVSIRMTDAGEEVWLEGKSLGCKDTSTASPTFTQENQRIREIVSEKSSQNLAAMDNTRRHDQPSHELRQLRLNGAQACDDREKCKGPLPTPEADAANSCKEHSMSEHPSNIDPGSPSTQSQSHLKQQIVKKPENANIIPEVVQSHERSSPYSGCASEVLESQEPASSDSNWDESEKSFSSSAAALREAGDQFTEKAVKPSKFRAECPHCKRSIELRRILEHIEARHKQTFKLNCSLCPSYFYNFRNLRRHHFWEHKGLPYSAERSFQYSCLDDFNSSRTICPGRSNQLSHSASDQFSDTNSLQEPPTLELGRPGSKNAKTTVVAKGTKSSGIDNTFLKPFLCNICDKSFKRKAHCKRHIQNVHYGRERHVV